MKNRFAFLAAVLLICLVLSGCTPSDSRGQPMPVLSTGTNRKSALVGGIPIAFPLVSQPATMNILATGYNGRDQSNVYVWRTYEKMTGVSINWLTTSKEKRAEVVLSALTNQQNIDLILRCKISANRLLQYGQSGLILDLAKDGLLQKNAPNCWAYLQAHPDTMASVINPDGTIYALPQVNSGPELRVAQKLYFNKQWLERVHMELPTTTAELQAVLEAFLTQDANGNGDPNDEIPLSSPDWGSIRMSLYGAFGLANRGFHNETVDCDPITGKIRLIEGCDAYRDYLAYTHELYAGGFIDKYIFSLTEDQWFSKAANDLIGCFASTNLASLPADKVDNWVAIDEALEGPKGDKLWAAVRANFHSTGAALIPATCQDPALALRWLDYFWTDEGTLFYHMGVEGETFQVLEDGTYDYLPAIYEEMARENQSFDDVVSLYSPYPGGSNPTVEIAPYFMGGEMADVPARAARALFQYGPTEYWPSFTFTAEENERLSTISSDIEKYCDTMQRSFVTGQTPLREWDAYVDQLTKMKLDTMLSVYQAAVDRYHMLHNALESSPGPQ